MVNMLGKRNTFSHKRPIMILGCIAVLGLLEGARGQIVQIGPAELVYTYAQLQGIPSVSAHCRTTGGMNIDCQFWTMRTSPTISGPTPIQFIYAANGGIDIWNYTANPNDKFSDPLHSTYSKNPILTVKSDGTATDNVWVGGVKVLSADPLLTDGGRDNTVTWLRRRKVTTSSPLVAPCWPPPTNYYYDQPWIAAVYRDVATGDLLGFVHIETCIKGGEDGAYTIGLAYSKTNGKTWVYCGDIIKTANNISEGTDNITGIPYLVVNDKGTDYFYVYYCDYPSQCWCWCSNPGDPNYGRCDASGKRACVARAIKSDVLAKAKQIYGERLSSNNATPITSFYKYIGTGWDTHPATTRNVCGANIITYPLPRTQWIDLHSHAAYCTALKKYLLLVSNGVGNQGQFGTAGVPGILGLYASSDGITWKFLNVVDSSKTYSNTTTPSYIEKAQSFFVSMDVNPQGKPIASTDCDSVGSRFYIFTPYVNGGFDQQELWKHKITILPDMTPLNNYMLDDWKVK